MFACTRVVDKATTQDAVPVPSMVFAEAVELCHQEAGNSSKIVKAALPKLNAQIAVVRLKALQLLQYISQGYPPSLHDIAQISNQIQACIQWRGAPDAIKGFQIYDEIQGVAQRLLEQCMNAPPSIPQPQQFGRVSYESCSNVAPAAPAAPQSITTPYAQQTPYNPQPQQPGVITLGRVSPDAPVGPYGHSNTYGSFGNAPPENPAPARSITTPYQTQTAPYQAPQQGYNPGYQANYGQFAAMGNAPPTKKGLDQVKEIAQDTVGKVGKFIKNIGHKKGFGSYEEHPVYPQQNQQQQIYNYPQANYGQQQPMYQQQQQPAYNQPQYGQPQYGAPQYGQQPYGQPQYQPPPPQTINPTHAAEATLVGDFDVPVNYGKTSNVPAKKLTAPKKKPGPTTPGKKLLKVTGGRTMATANELNQFKQAMTVESIDELIEGLSDQDWKVRVRAILGLEIVGESYGLGAVSKCKNTVFGLVNAPQASLRTAATRFYESIKDVAPLSSTEGLAAFNFGDVAQNQNVNEGDFNFEAEPEEPANEEKEEAPAPEEQAEAHNE